MDFPGIRRSIRCQEFPLAPDCLNRGVRPTEVKMPRDGNGSAPQRDKQEELPL